jgi:hypothetical protein
LARTVHVSGDFSPETPTVAPTASVDGFDLTVSGGIVAGDASGLVISVLRDGQPVASLQPYLGAFGHLVALRDGDLAYLHVHPEGEAPTPGAVSGPRVSFVAHAPTPGLYLLYFDFQVDGQVHSGRFVLQAVPGDATGHAPSDIPEHGH